MVQSNTVKAVKNEPKLAVKFFQQGASGSEPVRNWLKALPLDEKKAIGEDIKAVQFGWPLGLPLVDHIDGDIWEVRTRLANRIARVLFVVDAMEARPPLGAGTTMVLLHGFIKKDRKTPKPDLDLAKDRLKRMRGTK
ncbi:MAG: type II toxin-antitoxin system RelE/ParE family toxin [Betaproteobacteria bacterium]|nr:MAG: type II toxin-antitoxin system RelE/ParE family toxin [Betaproteobacteria bacterium]